MGNNSCMSKNLDEDNHRSKNQNSMQIEKRPSIYQSKLKDQIQQNESIVSQSMTLDSNMQAALDEYENACRQTMNQKCSYCRQVILHESILAPCLHQYHEQCLITFVKDQLNRNRYQILCSCNKSLTNIFQSLRSCEIKFLMEQLYNNQLAVIKKLDIALNQEMQIQRCRQPDCNYFCIGDSPITFCPLCEI